MARAYYEDHGKVHPSLSSKPPLRGDCVRYLTIYRLLSGSRFWDQVGPKPIQISEINAVLDSAGVKDSETRMKYIRLMKRLDMAELKHLHEQMKRARGK